MGSEMCIRDRVYLASRRLSEAEKIYTEVEKIDRKLLGKEHPDYARDLNNLSLTKNALGKYRQAEELGRKALEIFARTRGRDDPEILSYLENLVMVLKCRGKLDEAEELARKGLSIPQTRDTHFLTGCLYLILSDIYREKGELKKARKFCGKARKVIRQALGENSDSYAYVLLSSGQLFLMEGKGEKAREELLKGKTLLERIFGTDGLPLSSVYATLGKFCQETGNLEKAEKYYQRALKISCKYWKKGHPEVVRDLGNLAGIYSLLGEREKARDFARRAKKMYKELGEDFPFSIEAENVLLKKK